MNAIIENGTPVIPSDFDPATATVNSTVAPLTVPTAPAIQTAPALQSLGLFANAEVMRSAQSMADFFAQSTLVPQHYQRNAGNCLIAIDVAIRMNTSPLMVMQNLNIIKGRPGWSSAWIIATINASGKYAHELRFDFSHEPRDGGLTCRAWTEDRTGYKLVGPAITLTIAEAEGWVNGNPGKWKNMPEMMLSYRAATAFSRRYCPELTLGIYAEEEVRAFVDAPTNAPIPSPAVPIATAARSAQIAAQALASASDPIEAVAVEVVAETLFEAPVEAVEAVPMPEEAPATVSKAQLVAMAERAKGLGDNYKDILHELMMAEGFTKSTDITADAYERIMRKIVTRLWDTN